MKPFIIGTAGHIDHGKSSLVKALTGTNPDRFEEELQRGMTIDLGFAFLTDTIAIIDVPGHEKFIKNMVAGVSTVDALMLVVAADDSVMPQTREHLHIAQILGIETGFVALNKIDVMSEEWLPLVEDEIRQMLEGTFLENAPIIHCSAKTGEGIEAIREMMLDLEGRLSPRSERPFFRLPVDRVFTLRGIGTVVTGSVLSGKIDSGETVFLYPEDVKARVRGLHSQGKSVLQVSRGQRAAVNIQGIDKKQLKRGDELAYPDILTVSDRFMVYLRTFDFAGMSIKHGHRIRFHLGTGEYIGRLYLAGVDGLQPGGEAYGQIVLEEKIAVGFRDRFLIRHYSPSHLLGGGMTLGLSFIKLRKKTGDLPGILQKMKDAPLPEALKTYLYYRRVAVSISEISRQFTRTESEMRDILEKDDDFIRFHEKRIMYILFRGLTEDLKEEFQDILSDFHEKHPREFGIDEFLLMKRLGLDSRTFAFLKQEMTEARLIRMKGNRIARYDFEIRITSEEEKSLEVMRSFLSSDSFSPENLGVIRRKIQEDSNLADWMLDYLIDQGEWILITGEIVMPRESLEHAREKTVRLLKEKQQATVSEIKEALGTTRKNLIPVLNYFDSTGVTERKGDLRVLGEKYR